MQAASDDLDARRPVWQALSTMFLDADVSLTRAPRSQLLAASPYSLPELELILIEEVYPVCWAQLSAETGPCPDFDPDVLEAQIVGCSALSENRRRLIDLGRIAVPRSREWLATRAMVETLRRGGTENGP